MLKFLSGKKTYIVGVVAGVVTAIHYMGFMDVETYQKVMGFLGSVGLITLRMGVSKAENS
jgi:hypothetical protein